MFFLGEAADASIAQLLLDTSIARKNPNYSMIGFTQGQLFCFVVAGALVSEVKPFEISESLNRFSEGITTILRRNVASPRISPNVDGENRGVGEADAQVTWHIPS